MRYIMVVAIVFTSRAALAEMKLLTCNDSNVPAFVMELDNLRKVLGKNSPQLGKIVESKMAECDGAAIAETRTFLFDTDDLDASGDNIAEGTVTDCSGSAPTTSLYSILATPSTITFKVQSDISYALTINRARLTGVGTSSFEQNFVCILSDVQNQNQL